MPLALSNASTFTSGKRLQKSNGSAFAAISSLYQSDGVTWIRKGGVSAASPTSVTKDGGRGSTLSDIITMSGFSTSYSTVWVSGGTNITVSISGAAITVSSSTTAGTLTQVRSGTLRVTGNDGSAPVDVPVSFTFEGSGI